MLDYQHSGSGMNDVMTRIMHVLYDWVNVVNRMHFKHCMLHLREKGGLSHLPPKFEHIFVALITFPPFFCADTFITSLLLIVCALR